MELRTREHLTTILNQRAVTKKEIMENILNDEDVLFSWTLLITGDIGEDDLTNELLTYVVELWLAIRGNSCVGEWMEYYKQTKQEVIKQNKSLRKVLKRGKFPETE